MPRYQRGLRSILLLESVGGENWGGLCGDMEKQTNARRAKLASRQTLISEKLV